MDGSARMPAIGVVAASCVQPHRDDKVILVSFDETCDVALGDGEGDVHALHDGEDASGHNRPRGNPLPSTQSEQEFVHTFGADGLSLRVGSRVVDGARRTLYIGRRGSR